MIAFQDFLFNKNIHVCVTWCLLLMKLIWISIKVLYIGTVTINWIEYCVRCLLISFQKFCDLWDTPWTQIPGKLTVLTEVSHLQTIFTLYSQKGRPQIWRYKNYVFTQSCTVLRTNGVIKGQDNKILVQNIRFTSIKLTISRLKSRKDR